MSQPAFLAAILHAVQEECIALVSDKGKFVGGFVLMTNYHDTGEITYIFPLLILDATNGQDSHEYLGGASSMDWDFRLNVYGYDPNSYGDDHGGSSEANLNPIDIVRTHFSLRNWLTPGMAEIESKYGFKMTYAGSHRALVLKHADGLALGWAHLWQSAAVDPGTDKVEETYPLKSATDVTMPPVE